MKVRWIFLIALAAIVVILPMFIGCGGGGTDINPPPVETEAVSVNQKFVERGSLQPVVGLKVRWTIQTRQDPSETDGSGAVRVLFDRPKGTPAEVTFYSPEAEPRFASTKVTVPAGAHMPFTPPAIKVEPEDSGPPPTRSFGDVLAETFDLTREVWLKMTNTDKDGVVTDVIPMDFAIVHRASDDIVQEGVSFTYAGLRVNDEGTWLAFTVLRPGRTYVEAYGADDPGKTNPASGVITLVDRDPPRVMMNEPENRTVSEVVTFDITTTDNDQVKSVVVYLNEQDIGQGVSEAKFTWDSTQLADGTYPLVITAHDRWGNRKDIITTITINNTPVEWPPGPTEGSITLTQVGEDIDLDDVLPILPEGYSVSEPRYITLGPDGRHYIGGFNGEDYVAILSPELEFERFVEIPTRTGVGVGDVDAQGIIWTIDDYGHIRSVNPNNGTVESHGTIQELGMPRQLFIERGSNTWYVAGSWETYQVKDLQIKRTFVPEFGYITASNSLALPGYDLLVIGRTAGLNSGSLTGYQLSGNETVKYYELEEHKTHPNSLTDIPSRNTFLVASQPRLMFFGYNGQPVASANQEASLSLASPRLNPDGNIVGLKWNPEGNDITKMCYRVYSF